VADYSTVTPLFDAAWYVATYPDTAGRDAWDHFRRIGAATGRDPNPLFSTTWYLRRYLSAASTGFEALQDYVNRGVELGRDPGPLFCTRWYLASNPDVARTRVNPLEHYLCRGASELRDPSPVFDSSWYFSTYPHAAAPGMDARTHYMRQGASLGYDPCPFFSTRWYLDTYRQVAVSGQNPLLHYLTDGTAQGFDPGPYFSTREYLGNHQELAATGENPLVHYLAYNSDRHRTTANFIAGFSGQLSRAAIAEAHAVIQALSPIEPDLAALPKTLEEISVVTFEPDRATAAWRGLYLSIYGLPQRLVLTGSIDDASGLTHLVENTADLLIVETDVQVPSVGVSLPSGVQWRSFAEFGADLDWGDRVRLASALVNSLQPVSLLVWGSEAGWEVLARQGFAMRRNTALFATATAAPKLSVTELLRRYFRSCIPVLSALYGPDQHELHNVGALFGLPAGERSKLRNIGDWRDADGFLSPREAQS
jgi:hypothetical protein